MSVKTSSQVRISRSDTTISTSGFGSGCAGFPGQVYFLVAGGGGGGGSVTLPAPPILYAQAGAGGGGGVVIGSTIVTQSSYTITIGSGGAGGKPAANGTNTTIVGTGVNITALGGGGGGTASLGFPGGSGGGSAGDTALAASGIQFCQPQTVTKGIYANYGSPGQSAVNFGGGGGGGAAGYPIAVCSGVATPSKKSNGANGISSNITGTNVYYGGGGQSAVQTVNYNNGLGSAYFGNYNGGGGGSGRNNPLAFTGNTGSCGVVVVSYANPKPIANGGTITCTTTGLFPGTIMQIHTFTAPGTFTRTS
jgi:hypothetical protein